VQTGPLDFAQAHTINQHILFAEAVAAVLQLQGADAAASLPHVSSPSSAFRVAPLPKHSPMRCLELFSGSGALTALLAPHVESIVAAELMPRAIQRAEVALAASGATNVSMVQADLGGLAGWERLAGTIGSDAVDLAVVNPPRRGLPLVTIEQLQSSIRPQAILYISCKPESLGRDAEALGKGAGATYQLMSCQPVDMFPHSPHVETVNVFVRADLVSAVDDS
jgi:tRNA/tmRNA/rRNA uracil-C5-methylase (TrmA/RlmC/RlmD family)